MIVLRVLHIFAPCHNLQQFKYSKKLTVYIFLPGFCARCFCTVCPVHLVRVRLNMWMEEDSAWQYASKIKHTDVYYQDINCNCLYLLYYIYNEQCNQ